MSACIPGASGVVQVDDATYDAKVSAKIGPISARFGCRISIAQLDESAYSGTVEVTGKDTKLGSSVKARMLMSMREDGGSTTVDIHSEVEVMGRIGQYGHGMLSKRADAMLADFVACAQSRLAEMS